MTVTKAKKKTGKNQTIEMSMTRKNSGNIENMMLPNKC